MELYVTIDEVKGSIPGYVDYGKDDTRLYRLIEAAQRNLEKRLQRPLSDPECMCDGCLSSDLREAIIVKVVTMYDTPSDISFAKVYNTGRVEDMIVPYIKFRRD